MTSIILWMWLSDIVGSISVIGVLSLVAFFIWLLIAGIGSAVEEDSDILMRAIQNAKWLLIPVAIASVVPSKSTVQLVAASQAVSVAANTELGKKSVQAIEALLAKINSETNKSAK